MVMGEGAASRDIHRSLARTVTGEGSEACRGLKNAERNAAEIEEHCENGD
jgi:hypothetical protein